MSTKQEKIFGAFVMVRGIGDVVYGNLNSNTFLGHLNLD